MIVMNLMETGCMGKKPLEIRVEATQEIGRSYSEKEAAYILHVSVRTIQRRCRAGKLNFIRVERAVRIPHAELMRYMQENLVVAK